MTLTDEKEVLETPARQLKIADRCDSCGAQAFVLVKMLAGELMFCGHHYKKHQEKLDNEAFEIVDERDAINAKPSQSSPE
jgi:ribosomal protein S14